MEKLYFKNIPNIFTNGQEVYLVGLDLSGIQKYIFNILENRDSLKQIKKRSLEISELTEYLVDEINKSFPLISERIITKSSGKVVFVLDKDVDLVSLESLLNLLQKDIYLNYSGEIKMFFGIIKTIITNEAYTNQITAYHELLRKIQINKRQSFDTLSYDKNKDFNEIDLRIDLKDGQLIDDLIDSSSRHQYVTGLKLDFDNLGSYFGRIGYSDVILSESKKLRNNIEKILNDTRNIYKVFIGGDDIFILVKFDETFTKLLEIKENLEASFKNTSYKFSLSAGIAVFNKKTSIIYYGEKLEEELSNAKISGKNGISIEGFYFNWDEFIQISEQIEYIINRLKTKSEAYHSKLANIENSLKSIILETDKNLLISNFILKIPQFLDKIDWIIPKELMLYQPDKINEYYKKIFKFYFTIKYVNRFLRKDK